MSEVHLRYEGVSYDVSFRDLGDIGDLSTDQQIRQAVATHLDAPVSKFNQFSLSRNESTGAITMRPPAPFGA